MLPPNQPVEHKGGHRLAHEECTLHTAVPKASLGLKQRQRVKNQLVIVTLV